jgi:hypothetical protein
MKKIIVILLMLINAACSTSTYMPLNPLNAKQARVYVIRDYAEPTAWNLWVDVDGKRAASLSNRSFAAFSADLGTHQFLFDWPPVASSVQLDTTIDLHESKNYYFVIKGRAALTGYVPNFNGATLYFNEQIEMLEIEESEATILLGKLGNG